MLRLLHSLILIVPGLFVVIVLVVLGTWWLQRLRRALYQDSSDSSDELAQQFFKMRRDGQISEEEYKVIRANLSSQRRTS
ncbi:MAG TPA: hypothetical protein PLD05_12295 [Thermogutta sp.]|nr:hypothetical protein [Thermogutta sp.]HPU07273.1 hypothetical protein [Thermogutta sp.]